MPSTKPVFSSANRYIESLKREALKDFARGLLERMELEDVAVATFRLTYRLNAEDRVSWRPHGDSSLNPVFSKTDWIRIRHNRRAA